MTIQRFYISEDYEINTNPAGDMVMMGYMEYRELETKISKLEGMMLSHQGVISEVVRELEKLIEDEK